MREHFCKQHFHEWLSQKLLCKKDKQYLYLNEKKWNNIVKQIWKKMLQSTTVLDYASSKFNVQMIMFKYLHARMHLHMNVHQKSLYRGVKVLVWLYTTFPNLHERSATSSCCTDDALFLNSLAFHFAGPKYFNDFV